MKKKWNTGIRAIVEEINRINRLHIVEENDYIRLHKCIKILPKIGNLRANHVCAIASIVGIIPLCMYQWIMGGADKGIKLLEKTIGTLPSSETVIQNICFGTEVVTGEKICSTRGGENIVCKIG